MSRRQDFLNAVMAQLKSKHLRDSTRNELESHLADSSEGLEACGVPAQLAEELAVLRLGDPTKLGRSIRIANRPFYLRFSFLAPVLLMAGVCLVFASLISFEQAWHSSMVAQSKQKLQYEADFLDDQRALASHPFFGQKERNERDAGPYLNPLIAWDGNSVRGSRPEIVVPPSVQRSLHLANLKGKSNWLDLLDPALDRVDVSWMQKLETFDHWDLTTGRDNVVRAYLQEGNSLSSMPMPDLMSLQDMARLRLRKGYLEKKPLAALKEVRKLAELIYSNETLISSMVARGIVGGIERQAYDRFVADGLLPATVWKPISKEDDLRARRALYAISGWLTFDNDPSQIRKILSKPHPQLGLCGGLMGMAYGDSLSREFLEPSLPFERDYSEYFALTKELLNGKFGCRLSMAKINAQHPSQPEMVYSGDLTALLQNFVGAYGYHIPYLRRAYVAMLWQIAIPNFHAKYAELHANRGQ